METLIWDPHLIGYKKVVDPPPLTLAKSKTASAGKRKTMLRLSVYYRKSYAPRTQVVYTFATGLFCIQRHILKKVVLDITVFACKLLFTDLQGFWAHFSAKTSQKCKRRKNVGQRNTDHIYFKLIWSCSFSTWFTLTKHSSMMHVLFSWAYNLIYTFTILILRMQCHVYF